MSYLANLLPYATLMAVVVGIVSGGVSVRHWQRTRYLTAATQLVEMLQGPEFTRSVQRITEHEGGDAQSLLAEILGPTFADWFQWLAERLIEQPGPERVIGAAAAHREWRA